MSEPRLQLPIVIVTADADPAELAEKIVRQNPEHFGDVDLDGVYVKREPVDTAPRKEEDFYPIIDKPGLTALTVNGEIWERRDRKGKFYRQAAIIFGISSVLGWGTAAASRIWGL